jgi:hypothetical protein
VRVLFIGVTVAFALAGCASFPTGSAVTSFSQATTTATTLLQNASKMDVLLAQRLGYEQAVTSYVDGDKDVILPPHDFALLPKQQIAARIEVLKAIAGYADALGALNDPQQETKVGDAVAKLASSVTAFAQTTNPKANTAALAPAFGLLGSGVTFLVSQRNAVVIHESVVAAHPYIAQAAALLAQDFDVLNRRFGRRLGQLRDFQKKKMAVLRSDVKITRIDLEKRYQDLYGADQDLAAQVAALAKSKEILQALVDAHDALRSSQDTDRAIQDFQTLVSAIALDVQQIKKAQQ